jgi:hypothetical protein
MSAEKPKLLFISLTVKVDFTVNLNFYSRLRTDAVK